MGLNLYNTLSRKIESFQPIAEKSVGLYCCGPTVYNYQHIGNLRTYIFEDLLSRTIRYLGYPLKHVMNITDVGHLVSDADSGEDKMLVAVKREGKKSEDIAQYYTEVFFEHCSWLNIKKPDIICKATEHIQEMIELISRLIEKDVAYLSGGNVYFDVEKFNSYGELAKLDLESLKAGARIAIDENKRNELDFALWFTKSKFENQELQWDSPWGRGYPGWHIECSAMSIKHLGESFDIHCGGIDHIPVHHTNEIAQSEAATGKPFAKYWLHGAFLVVDKNKMSKSTGEFLTLDVLKDKGYNPMAYRLLCLGTSYRKELAWSWEALDGAQNSLKKIKEAVLELKSKEQEKADNPALVNELEQGFRNAIADDLGIPKALASLHKVINHKNLSNKDKLELLSNFDLVLGLGIDSWEKLEIEAPETVIELAKARQIARKAKDWHEADRLRAKIQEQGFSVKDTAESFELKKI